MARPRLYGEMCGVHSIQVPDSVWQGITQAAQDAGQGKGQLVVSILQQWLQVNGV